MTEEALRRHQCDESSRVVGRKRSLSVTSDDNYNDDTRSSISIFPERTVSGSPDGREKQPKRKAAPPPSYNFYEPPWSNSSAAGRLQPIKVRPEVERSLDELQALTRHPGWQDGWDMVDGHSLNGGTRKIVQTQATSKAKVWFTILKDTPNHDVAN